MVRLQLRCFDRGNNYQPILSNREIDEYAHALLEDYKPELLRNPGTINYQHFLESYLGMQILFYDIYSDDPDKPILALTAFREGKIKVFDRDNGCIKKIVIPARSVVMDNSIVDIGKEHLALFTGMHEAGHATMQWHVYTGETFDGEPFDPDYDWNNSIKPIVYCRRSNIESRLTVGKKPTPEEWREHHADCFAAAITMPNKTFRPFVTGLLREHSYYRSTTITLGKDEDWDILALDLLPDAISDVYGVSKRAARIKLKTSGFIIGKV